MKFAADENFDNRILRGLLRRQPQVDIVRIQDTEIASAADPVVLAWAAQEGRILLTHDEKTIPRYAYERIAAGELLTGVVVASDTLALSGVIEDLEVIVLCSTMADWHHRVQRLPL
jgi:hypothetical protein